MTSVCDGRWKIASTNGRDIFFSPPCLPGLVSFGLHLAYADVVENHEEPLYQLPDTRLRAVFPTPSSKSCYGLIGVYEAPHRPCRPQALKDSRRPCVGLFWTPLYQPYSSNCHVLHQLFSTQPLSHTAEPNRAHLRNAKRCPPGKICGRISRWDVCCQLALACLHVSPFSSFSHFFLRSLQPQCPFPLSIYFLPESLSVVRISFTSPYRPVSFHGFRPVLTQILRR